MFKNNDYVDILCLKGLCEIVSREYIIIASLKSRQTCTIHYGYWETSLRYITSSWPWSKSAKTFLTKSKLEIKFLLFKLILYHVITKHLNMTWS